MSMTDVEKATFFSGAQPGTPQHDEYLVELKHDEELFAEVFAPKKVEQLTEAQIADREAIRQTRRDLERLDRRSKRRSEASRRRWVANLPR
jgi:hypothetical protein